MALISKEMMKNKTDNDADWDTCTWEGARRQALREWSKLPLERIIAALEEMEKVGQLFQADTGAGNVRKT